MREAEMRPELVQVTSSGEVGVIMINNPPVNALGLAVRASLAVAFDRLMRDDATGAVVIGCGGQTFSAGGDITEFGRQNQAPKLPDILAQIDNAKKPVIAALHGNALGGGLELALACSYRVAERNTRLGLPEVKLGLIPGAGGTVRLPRLIGPRKALALILSGNPVSADQALADGLIDAIVEGDLIARAISFARDRLAEGNAPARAAWMPSATDIEAFETDAADGARKSRGLIAPITCIQAVRNAITMRMDNALAEEARLFGELVKGEQSRAQRHIFFAERVASKVVDIDKSVAPRAVRRVGIIGAGTMGAGIAMAFANSGYAVTVVDLNQGAVLRCMAAIEQNYTTSVARASLSLDEKHSRIGRIAGSHSFQDLAGCDLIIEAAFEDMAVKKDIFARLDAVATQNAILATNTSYLDINEIAACTCRPRDVVGLHFFSPANVMKLLEIVRAKETAPDVVATALSLAKQIGKIAVVVGVCRGFVGNRMLAARGCENEALLMEGALPAQIDKVFTEFGWPMGPFQMGDLAGLDIGWRNRKALGKTAAIADALCEQGRFGQKTGRGFYRYADGSRVPILDPEVEQLIRDLAHKHGTRRRLISDEEILERTLYPMINEGARILDEGITARESDIDVVWVHGYGFPLSKGGPMFWARSHGLSSIRAKLLLWFESTGRAHFMPSVRLAAMAADQN